MSKIKESVVLGTGRLSFPFLFEPQEPEGKGKPKFTTSFIIPKDAVLKRPGHPDMTMAEMKKAVQRMAANTAKEKWGDAIPAKVKKQIKEAAWFRDGDEKFDEDREKNYMYEASYIFNASAWPTKNGNARFLIFGKNPRQPITDPEEVYGGRFAKIQVSSWAYDFQLEKGGKAQGIGLIIEAIQVLTIDGDPGAPFGGGAAAEDAASAFGAGDGSDDPLNYEDSGDSGSPDSGDFDDDLGL